MMNMPLHLFKYTKMLASVSDENWILITEPKISFTQTIHTHTPPSSWLSPLLLISATLDGALLRHWQIL